MSKDIKPGSFADGIRKLNTRGALCRPANLTKIRARLLLRYMDTFKREWYCDHSEQDPDYEKDETDMQMAMQWILNQVNKRWPQNELFSDEHPQAIDKETLKQKQ